MNASILSIGDELASGLTTNTNSAWLAQQLTALGINTTFHITVADQMTPIIEAIHASLEKSDLLLITGGLGPTEDDLTRQGLAAALNEELVEDPDAVLLIEEWFKTRSRPMSASNRLQALRPLSASVIENTCGTAPGLRTTKGRTEIFVMPGVPREMQEMFNRLVLPKLQEQTGTTVTRLTKINTFGVGESILGEKIHDLMTRGANPSVGTTVHDGIVSVRIYATGTPEFAAAETERIRGVVRERLGPLVYGEGETPLESAVADLLKDRRLTVATAESCTGGELARLFTNVPGSSIYFLRGWVTYANDAKEDELGVGPTLLQQHGAVSEEVARAMADGARRRAATDFGLSTTGVAGPDGGSTEKPVGTVWISLAHAAGTFAQRFIFPGDRAAVRSRASQMALAMLRWHILGEKPPA